MAIAATALTSASPNPILSVTNGADGGNGDKGDGRGAGDKSGVELLSSAPPPSEPTIFSGDLRPSGASAEGPASAASTSATGPLVPRFRVPAPRLMTSQPSALATMEASESLETSSTGGASAAAAGVTATGVTPEASFCRSPPLGNRSPLLRVPAAPRSPAWGGIGVSVWPPGATPEGKVSKRICTSGTWWDVIEVPVVHGGML
jgi:hypothetical protein